MESQRLLTISEVAQILRVSRHTIYGWVALRKIPYRKAGRLLRFDRQEVENWSRKGISAPRPA